MNTQKQISEPDQPFGEPLRPLPATAADLPSADAGKPEAAAGPSVAMDPERHLPSEAELEGSGAWEAAGMPLAVVPKSRAPRWQFWKRPNKRDLQLDTLRQGACEMVGLMRSIRDHLEADRGERDGLRKTLTPLPVAVESLRAMSEHQADAGRVLGDLRSSLERRAENENLLIKSLERIGHTMSSVDETFGQMDRTLSGIDRSNQQAASTMKKLGERVEDSDRFMSETFARLRDAEREFAEYVSRTFRRSNFATMALCSILLLSVVAVGFMFRENRRLLTAVQQNGALVVQVPQRVSPEQVTILEELEPVDDGIGKPERELVKTPNDQRKPVDGVVVPVETNGGSPLLSVNKLPDRE